MPDILKQLLIKVAQEEGGAEEEPFSPVYIGDPLKMSKSAKPFRQGEALMTAATWMGGSLFFGYLLKLLNKATITDLEKKTDPTNIFKNDPEGLDQYKKNSTLINFGRLGSAGLAGYGSSAISQIIGGQRYNYMGYKVPTQPRDVVIAFTGGASGAHRGKKKRDNDMDVADLDRRYGKGRYALFNNQDMDEAKEFLMNLPKGCRIRIQGHSYGGPAAYKLARFASENGVPIDRLDTLDPVGLDPEMKLHGKPALVKTWENHLPSKVRPWYWPDLVAILGHNKREVPGAKNIIYDDPRYNDHTNIRLVDFAGDRKKDYSLNMNAEHPLSPFFGLPKEGSEEDFKKYVGIGAGIGAAGTSLFYALLSKSPTFWKTVGWGALGGLGGGVAGAGTYKANSIINPPLEHVNNILQNVEDASSTLKNDLEQVGKDAKAVSADAREMSSQGKVISDSTIGKIADFIKKIN